MKLFSNISGLSAICGAILAADKYKKPIADARQAGDLEKERKLILEAVHGWSCHEQYEKPSVKKKKKQKAAIKRNRKSR